MIQSEQRLSSPSGREERSAPKQLFKVLALAAAFLTLLGLPAEAQIRARLTGAGLETLGSISGAAAVDALDCDEDSESNFCIGSSCKEDFSCHTPEIPDLETVTSEIRISRALLDAGHISNCTILDLNVAMELDHTFVDDLDIRLEKASGPNSLLLGPGDGSSFVAGDHLDVLFDDDRNLPEGTHRVVRPGTPLSVFDGEDVVGVWRLRIADQAFFDSGRLVDWGLAFDLDCGEVSELAPCIADATSLCLNENRFRVTARYRTSSGDKGRGRAVELTDDTGYFWFFDRNNVEVVTKVLNACSFAHGVWVFAAGLTNVEVDVAVVDTQSGDFSEYHNDLNQAYTPIQDTASLKACP